MKIQRTPLFNLTLFKNYSFILGAITILCIYSTSSAFPMNIALFYQSGFNLNPFQAGLLFMPASVGFVASSLMTPKWQAHYGNRTLLIGALAYTSSYLILILMNTYFATKLSPYALIPIMMIIGFTQGMIMTPVLNWTLSFVPLHLIGIASGLTATLQQIGAAIGAAIVSTIMQIYLQTTMGHSILSQFQTAFIHSLFFNVIIMLVASIIIYQLMCQSSHSQ